ncbi:hypothetical protein [Roseovarius indicus]|uniref:Uncharacterized protein n=1 Tax=Roseovarius indicus TaxID=540747 RepID=A0A0T5P919_9RHOB|nr:hypothetical protein [Roseovarius indicus]KRS17532.1 hypothetical protein XM52_13725 [Roseovarius indicus]QEW26735.1 hypothetical protein RIdsm_02537 [Roseovarius indicus]SFD60878.1 hypothetical protein SAMN04488031_101805 [Roseovarius indicus]
MFRLAFFAALLATSPAVAMDHAACVKLQMDAYEAKAALWETSQRLRNARIDGTDQRETAKIAQDEAMAARFSVNDYIQRLSDLCETLR